MKQELQDYIKNNFRFKFGVIQRITANSRFKIGDIIKGCLNGKEDKDKYLVTTLRFNGKRYKVFLHVMIFLLVNGYVPDRVDHKDNNTLNNHPDNLRACTHKENCANRKQVRKNNLTGYKGVSYHKSTGKYRATIYVDGKQKHLGVFKCPKEAAKIYNKNALTYFGEFARINVID